MIVLVIFMSLIVVLALAVVCVVAIPARREGREVLTAKGEDVVSRVKEKTGSAVETAREKTSGALGAARNKVTDVTKPSQD
jgi:competence protein ComGC